MNPRERFEAGLARESTDRPAIMYQHLGAAKHVLAASDLTMRRGYHDPEAFARISIMAQRITGFDNVMAGWGDVLIEARAHGMQWAWPVKDVYPRVRKYLEFTPSNVDAMVSVDPMKDEYWSVPLRATEMMMDRVGREVMVLGCMVSPIAVVSEIFGLETLLIATIDEPWAVDRSLRTVVESLNNYGEHLSRMGVTAVFVEDGIADLSLHPPDNIERYDLASLKMVVDSFHSRGIKVISHNCSAQPYLEGYPKLGVDAITFHVPAVDLKETMTKYRGCFSIMAGIDQTVLLSTGTEQEIEMEVERIFEAWGDGPGLMMTTGCEMDSGTPVENIIAFREAVVRHGSSRD